MTSPRPSSETHESHVHAIARVLPFMRERSGEPLDLEALASVAYMSSFHFLRIFRELTGVPPVQFLGALRIERAKRLLIESEESVLDICHEVGYASLGSFTRRFTLLVGLPPGRFRELGQSFYRDLESVLAVAASCPLPPGCGILRAGVRRSHPGQVVFGGLFDTPIPQSRPLTCAVLLHQDNEMVLATPTSGKAWLFSVAMDPDAEPIDLLVGGQAVRAVAAAGPFDFDEEEEPPRLELELRPPDPFDPPMLLALPLLLHERMAEMGVPLDEPPLDG